MNKKFDVIQVGFGPMGRIIANLLITRRNINLRGIIDIDPQLIGEKLSEIIDIEEGSNLIVESDFDELLSRERVDVIIIATSSSLEKVAPIIKRAIESESNVISICEELSYPYQSYPQLSEELDALAKSNNVTVVGTGINPGYLMDLLPIVITAPCQKVESVKVTRMMNSAKRRESFQRKIGTGLTPEEFHQKITKKEITGHVGLKESIQMIITALGFQCDEIIEFSPKEIIAEKEFTTSYSQTVPEGYVCGLESKAVARREGRDIILLDFIAYAGDHEEYDSIETIGVPSIHQKIIGGVHGDLGTAAMVANLIPKVVGAKAGLLTMKDLPVPCYTENIWRN
ncbi:MAG: dihydrodipicolinate reductase [Promethearchaeota archaeon]